MGGLQRGYEQNHAAAYEPPLVPVARAGRGRTLSWLSVGIGLFLFLVTLLLLVTRYFHENLQSPRSERLATLLTMPESQLLRPGDTLVQRWTNGPTWVIPIGSPASYAAVQIEVSTTSPQEAVLDWYDRELVGRGWTRLRGDGGSSGRWRKNRHSFDVVFLNGDEGPRSALHSTTTSA